MALSANEADDLDDSSDLDDDDDQVSDEDTEDASETEVVRREEEFTGIKEQMYQDKLAQLKRQLQQLRDGTLPDVVKKLKKIDQHLQDRLAFNKMWFDFEMELIEEEYMKEKRAAAKEFEEKKVDLRENLIQELEEKKKMIEHERGTMELTGDTMAVKPVTTRKLRRRPNDPIPQPEKRRKPSPVQLTYRLDDQEIAEDLALINKVSGKPLSKISQTPTALASSGANDFMYEACIEDAKLCYEKRWFHRDQAVVIETKDQGKINATITAIGTDDFWIKKTADNAKLRISLAQLQKGQYVIRRRSP